MRKIFIFKKQEVIKKFVGLHPELLPLQNYMLRLLRVYRDYTRFGLREDTNLDKFMETVEEILKIVEGELRKEG